MKLSESEYSIMEIIWAKKAPVTSLDICELSDQHGWKAPTVLTFLKRLCEKAFLKAKKSASCAITPRLSAKKITPVPKQRPL